MPQYILMLLLFVKGGTMVSQVAILVVMYILLLIIKWRNLGKKSILLYSLMYIYISLVICVTMLPIDLTLDLKWKYDSSIDFSYANLKPFNDYILGRIGSTNQIILNVIMTIPFGFLYPLIRKSSNFIKTVLVTFFMSLSIETIQLIMTIFLLKHRSFDVTDLITNTLGGVIGYIIFKATHKTHNKIFSN